MAIHWEYPVYLIAYSGGYASIVDPDSTADPAEELLIVMSEEEHALKLMGDFSILGAPKVLQNDREFGWLLQSLQAPVTAICFDPAPQGEAINAKWTCSISEMLSSYLQMDYSPWNYPVYFIKQETGYSSILGQAADGKEVIVLNLFTSQQKADDFLEAAKEPGEVLEYQNMPEVKQFLEQMQGSAAAVAIDPEVSEAGRSAKNCLGIESLLTKYLAAEPFSS